MKIDKEPASRRAPVPEIPSLARHGPHPPDWRRIACVLIFAALLPFALPASCVLYINLIPAHSASFHVAEIDTTVSLAFHWLWPGSGNDSGRYLTVRSTQGSITHQMCEFDWAHNPRTGVYLTGEGRIGVHDAGECLGVERPNLVVSKNVPPGWRHLGAFDFVPGHAPGTQELRFIPTPR